MMKTNTFLTFISRSTSLRSLHHASCSQLPTAKPMMCTKAPPLLFPTRNAHRQHRHYLSATRDENNNHDELEQNGMMEAFSYLETLTTDDWDANSIQSEQNNYYSSALKYSRTDDTPASNFGKSTEEEVQHYLEMQQQLEGTAAIELDDDGKLSGEEGVSLESSHVDANLHDIKEQPWTSINPILRLRGPVATGYGRGGKKLGIPTANLPASLFQSALDGITTGVYFGWAVIEQPTSSTMSNEHVTAKGRNVPVKAVVNVGYSPTFEGNENAEKIVEAHLITKSSPMTVPESDAFDGSSDVGNTTDEIEGDFYGETMRLQLIGYLRPEKKFDSFPELIAQIHRDIGSANWALDSMPFVLSKEDEFIKHSTSQWIGSGGGDCLASWENEEW